MVYLYIYIYVPSITTNVTAS